MNGRSGILRGSGVPSPIPEAAAPPAMRFTVFTKKTGIGEARSRTTLRGRPKRPGTANVRYRVALVLH
jgi:hypothetical protein